MGCNAAPTGNEGRPKTGLSLDLKSDALADGHRFRILRVINDFSRECLAAVVDTSISGIRVCRRIGYPATIRVDRDSEFISRDLDLWAYQRGVTVDFSRPGKPTDNAFIEAFNGRFRAECLNSHWFMSLEGTAEKLEAWRRDYNEERPHSAIGNKVLAELMKLPDASTPSV